MGVKKNYTITGDILLSLGHIDNKLQVYINRARGLASADSNGSSDPYVMIFVQSDNEESFYKKKTEIKRKTLNPLFREYFSVS